MFSGHRPFRDLILLSSLLFIRKTRFQKGQTPESKTHEFHTKTTESSQKYFPKKNSESS